MNKQLNYINNQPPGANPTNVFGPQNLFYLNRKIFLSYNDLELHYNHDFGVFTTKIE